MRKVKKVDEKQDEKRVILITILGVIISLVALATSLKVLIDKNKKEDNKAEVQSVEKLTNIMDGVYKQLNTISNIADYIYTDKEVKFQNINEQIKIYSILKYLYNQNDYDDIDEETYNRLFLSETSNISQYKKITKKKIVKTYKEIYNKDIDNIKIDNMEDKCPNFKYDNDTYYLNMWCMEDTKNAVYLYDTIREGNKVKTYVAVGKQVLKEGNKYQLINPKYPDKVYKKNYIDSSNYKEFDKYEVYFHKKGNLFYLRKISKEGK